MEYADDLCSVVALLCEEEDEMEAEREEEEDKMPESDL